MEQAGLWQEKKLEERREEKKVLYGRRVERLDDSRLVKMIMKKMQDCGSVSWQGEYDLLLSMGWKVVRQGQQRSGKRG